MEGSANRFSVEPDYLMATSHASYIIALDAPLPLSLSSPSLIYLFILIFK